MSVATANVFALLDDEGTVDAGELAAKLPIAQKEAPKQVVAEAKSGEEGCMNVMMLLLLYVWPGTVC